MKSLVASLFMLMGALLCTTPAHAATLHGTVSSGASRTPIAGARITLHAARMERTATTDAEGAYQFGDLEAGKAYTLAVEASGLTRFEQRGIVLAANEDRLFD
ncbi:MAG TPA: carboxypeptidase-like regulatory domain-containing protein, partial [Terracidiphilus sp.]